MLMLFVTELVEYHQLKSVYGQLGDKPTPVFSETIVQIGHSIGRT